MSGDYLNSFSPSDSGLLDAFSLLPKQPVGDGARADSGAPGPPPPAASPEPGDARLDARLKEVEPPPGFVARMQRGLEG